MSYEVPIERGKIGEFARAAHSEHPAHFGADAVIPPTFLTTGRLLWATADQRLTNELGFDLKRLLHGEEEYVFHGPPPVAGQTLIAGARIAERYEREGRRGGTMRVAVMITEFCDRDGNLVAEQRSTVLETSM